MDDYEPPTLLEFIRRVDDLIVTRAIDELESEFG